MYKRQVLDPSDYDGLEKALEEHDCSLYFSESPTNPYLRCVDVERISKLCKPKGCLVCIDGTFATPINSRALDFGADLVIHSASKYFGGHNDVLAGCIVGDKEAVGKVRQFHNIMGGVIDPHAAYLVLRGLKTLSLRVARHNDARARHHLRTSRAPLESSARRVYPRDGTGSRTRRWGRTDSRPAKASVLSAPSQIS